MNSRLVLTSTLLGALFLLSGIGVFSASAASPETLNNVQIFVQTSTDNISSYSLTVYNSSGYSVATATSNYPAFGVELPSGTFLFTVTAMQQSNYYYPMGVATSSNGVMVPYKAPVTEYGYTEQQVSGPVTFNVTTTSLENIPTSSLKLHVYYANETAASGVSVQASIVGEAYYYGGNNNIVMWNQTASDGSVTLVLPNIPVQISAWTWIPVALPKNETTVQTTVGGEQVNVTVYWSPTYVGLAADALIMPPFTSQNITLHVQQPNYWVMPYGVQTASGVASPQSTLANSAGGVPQSAYAQYQATRTTNQQTGQPQIAPLGGTTTYTLTAVSSQGTTIELLSVAVVGAIVLAALGMVVALRRK